MRSIKQNYRVLLVGGTSMIGKELYEFLTHKECDVVTTSRYHGDIIFNPYKSIYTIDDFEGFDCIINCMGSSIFRYWTNKAKKEIYNSRVASTERLVNILESLKSPPTLFVSLSAIGIYEKSGFLKHVCTDWETSALKFSGTTTILRLPIVLSKKGGMLKKILPSLYWGFGGYFGSGDQKLYFIHVKDIASTIYKKLSTSHIHKRQCIENLCIETPISHKIFIQKVAARLKKSVWLHIPKKLILLLLGEMGSRLLLQDQSIHFHDISRTPLLYKTIDEALDDLLLKE